MRSNECRAKRCMHSGMAHVRGMRQLHDSREEQLQGRDCQKTIGMPPVRREAAWLTKVTSTGPPHPIDVASEGRREAAQSTSEPRKGAARGSAEHERAEPRRRQAGQQQRPSAAKRQEAPHRQGAQVAATATARRLTVDVPRPRVRRLRAGACASDQSQPSRWRRGHL